MTTRVFVAFLLSVALGGAVAASSARPPAPQDPTPPVLDGGIPVSK